jgi:hypothetical protein
MPWTWNFPKTEASGKESDAEKALNQWLSIVIG